jgi:two-component system OmpR family response regulator
MLSMPHLLLVDDDEDILSLLTSFFRKHSHGVSVAENGAEMFAALEKQPIDLVILDVMLREEDGFDLCRRLRAQSQVPVIMLTAVADHTDRVVGLELGADDYLRRPWHRRAAKLGRYCVSPTGVSTSPGANCARPITRWCCSRAANSTYCWPLPNIPSGF